MITDIANMMYWKLAEIANTSIFCADSISNLDCMTMQASSPHICCDTDTGDFCRLQCNNGNCRCVDPATGVPVSDEFPENDESINCDPSKLVIRC